MNYALQIITAFLGSLGFSVLFNIRRTKLLIPSNRLSKLFGVWYNTIIKKSG